MPRSYAELLSDDPAWPDLVKAAASAPNGVVVLPTVSDAQRRACLEAIQVTTRSTLGALAHETGGLLVDHGFVRILGSGCERQPRQLAGWNAVVGVSLDDFIIVGDDVVGGVYAVDGTTGALGKKPGRVHYFAPDSLEWEDTELGFTDFVTWTFEGDLDGFYDPMRWPGWEQEIATLPGDRALSVQPPLWAQGKEGKTSIAKRDRRPVPSKELWLLEQQLRARAALSSKK